MEKLVNVNELAIILGVKPSWVYLRVRETGPGSMPRIRLGPKYVRFRLDEVMAWLKMENQSIG